MTLVTSFSSPIKGLMSPAKAGETLSKHHDKVLFGGRRYEL